MNKNNILDYILYINNVNHLFDDVSLKLLTTATASEVRTSLGDKVVKNAILVKTYTIVTSTHDIAIALGRFLRNNKNKIYLKLLTL